jgi:hypothetical protein
MKNLNLKLELSEAALADIKKLVKENSNDMDLGKQVRNYFFNLPEVLKEFKEEIDKQ